MKPEDYSFFANQHVDSLKQRLQYFQATGAEGDFGYLVGLVVGFEAKREKIDGDRTLTALGKAEALTAAAKKALAEVGKWSETKLSGVDQHAGQLRVQLLSKESTAPKPSDRQLDAMLARLQRFDPLEISIFYNSASDEERRIIEAAASSVGRLPTKADDGTLKWESLLDPASIAESIMARASASDPKTAARLADITELQAVYSTVGNVARKSIEAAVPGQHFGPDAVAAQAAGSRAS